MTGLVCVLLSVSIGPWQTYSWTAQSGGRAHGDKTLPTIHGEMWQRARNTKPQSCHRLSLALPAQGQPFPSLSWCPGVRVSGSVSRTDALGVCPAFCSASSTFGSLWLSTDCLPVSFLSLVSGGSHGDASGGRDGPLLLIIIGAVVRLCIYGQLD